MSTFLRIGQSPKTYFLCILEEYRENPVFNLYRTQCSVLVCFQLMLYVDGMNGVIKHGPTLRWLYKLIASNNRLVVKTALKLLIVFADYCIENSHLIVNAIRYEDLADKVMPWNNIIRSVNKLKESVINLQRSKLYFQNTGRRQ